MGTENRTKVGVDVVEVETEEANIAACPISCPAS